MTNQSANNATAPTAIAPIGVFDSGVGGLSVLRELRLLLPQEDFLYVADTAYAPYGERSEDEIRTRCFAIGDFLTTQGAKALLIACNTATAAALHPMRARYTVPVMALEPALKPAVAASLTGSVGVLATRRTLESAHFQQQAAAYAGQAKIIPQPCPKFVTLLEAGRQDSPAMQAALDEYIRPLLALGVDALVLGCTHFVFLRDAIQKLAGTSVTLHDSGAGVSRVVRDRLQQQQLLNPRSMTGNVRFFSSAATPETTAVMSRLWGTTLMLEPF